MDAAAGTLDARGTGVEVGLVLEEVQVAPGEGVGVVGLAGSGAERTSKAGTAGKVQEDVEATGFDGEAAMVNHPGWQQPQGRLEEFVLIEVGQGSVRIAGGAGFRKWTPDERLGRDAGIPAPIDYKRQAGSRAGPQQWHPRGINSLVQAAKAKARGYRSNRNFATIIYLIAGKLDLSCQPT